MRVLLLGRSPSGDLGLLLEQTEKGLHALGVDAVHEWAEGWIPPEATPEIDARVSQQIEWLTPGFDLVHAFGYRVGHACGRAFPKDRPWALSVLGSPPSGSMPGSCPLAISPTPKLNVQLRKWSGGEAETVIPGLRAPALDRAGCRAKLGVSDSSVCIVSVGESPLISPAAQLVRSRVPQMRWIAVGSESDAVDHAPDLDLPEILCAADLVVFPQAGDTFPMAALLAIHLHRPIVIRDQVDGVQLVENGRTGFIFDDDDSFGSVTSAAAQMQMTMSALASAVRVKAEEEFSLDRYARTLLSRYEHVLRKSRGNRS